MSEASIVVEAITMTEDEARSAYDGVKVNLEDANALIETLWTSGGWKHLGFASWDACCASWPKLVMTREELAGKHVELKNLGMSNRDIAAFTGSSKDSVRRDVGGGASAPPDSRVTGRDGKSYPAKQPKTDLPKERTLTVEESIAEGRPVVTVADRKAISAEIDAQFAPFMSALSRLSVPLIIPSLIEAVQSTVESIQNIQGPTVEDLELLDEHMLELTAALERLAMAREELRWKLS